MCRSSFKAIAFFLVIVAGLIPRFAVGEIVQDRLGPDGFPADWKPSDFAIGTEITSRTVIPGLGGMLPSAVSGSRVPLPVRVSGSTMVSATSMVGGSLTFVPREAVEGLGILKLGTGGEAPDVWQKTPRSEAENGLTRAVAQGVASPALREGWRRLLLTEAAPPVAADKGLRASWLAVRAATLEKIGLYEAVLGLWREVPMGALSEESLAAGWVKSQLLAGQGAQACALAKSKALTGDSAKGDGEWPVIMAVCQLVAPGGANVASAGLSLQLVEPMLRAKNPALLRILTAVQDGRAVTGLGGPGVAVDGMGGAVLAGYPALVGADVLPRLPDVALRRLVGSAALPEDLRGRAAVALARQTGLPQDGAAAWRLVSGTAFVGDLPDAVVVARGISVSDTAAYVQAALRLGMVDAAVKAMPLWEKMTGLGAAEVRQRVQAQLLLAALQGKVEDRLWDAWMLAQVLENQAGVRNAQRSLLVVEGLGVGVPGRIWQQLRDRAVPVSTLVDPAWQRLLAAAVQRQDVPQVIGLISEAWVGQPPAGVVPVVIGASLEALRRIGLDDIVRRVAAEAMLGIPSSHLIPLVAAENAGIAGVSGEMSGTRAVSAVSPSLPVSRTLPDILPPPRVAPVQKPTIRQPQKPTAPVMTAPKVGQ